MERRCGRGMGKNRGGGWRRGCRRPEKGAVRRAEDTSCKGEFKDDKLFCDCKGSFATGDFPGPGRPFRVRPDAGERRFARFLRVQPA